MIKKVYEGKLYLTQKDLLEHEFKVNARGYDPEEVDHILDMVIRDYGTLIKMTKDQRLEIENLTGDNALLKKELRNASDELEALKENDENREIPSNIDILRRLSNLEKVVFGKDE